jgi:hypothetical protein
MWQARVGELSAGLEPRDLSTLLWAYGKLQAYPGIEIMETLVMRARLSLDKHSPHVRDLPPPPSSPNASCSQKSLIRPFLAFVAVLKREPLCHNRAQAVLSKPQSAFWTAQTQMGAQLWLSWTRLQ